MSKDMVIRHDIKPPRAFWSINYTHEVRQTLEYRMRYFACLGLVLQRNLLCLARS
jgi:hypothetical protein